MRAVMGTLWAGTSLRLGLGPTTIATGGGCLPVTRVERAWADRQQRRGGEDCRGAAGGLLVDRQMGMRIERKTAMTTTTTAGRRCDATMIATSTPTTRIPPWRRHSRSCLVCCTVPSRTRLCPCRMHSDIAVATAPLS